MRAQTIDLQGLSITDAQGFTQDGLVAAMDQPEAPDYDAIYVDAWNSVLAQCKDRLERHQFIAAMGVKTADDFRQILSQLQTENQGKPQVVNLIRNLLPTLGHYEVFAATFVHLMKNNVDISMMWGLLSIAIRFSLKSDGVGDRVVELLRKIGHKLEYLNEYGRKNNDEHLKQVSADVHSDLVNLWLNVITIFKDKPEGSIKLEDVLIHFEEFIGRLDEAVSRIKDIVNLALAMRLKEREDFHTRIEPTLSVSSGVDETASLPFHQLPAARNPRFFGRVSELEEIHERVGEQVGTGAPASVALYGLGGVGKSQVALHYALSHSEDFDVILWLQASDDSLEISFSESAVKLKASQAKPGDHQQNRARLLLWLQRTQLRWLLIYDNVETYDVLAEFWPTAKTGTILLTSRKHVFAMQPANTGVEILPFAVDISSEFVLRVVSGRSTARRDDKETEAAKKLSEYLSGHPLALAQACSLGFKNRWNVRKLLVTYEKFPREIHKKLDPVLLHAGYTLSMSTVFLVSFQSLSQEAMKILSVISFLQPDQIPEDLFFVGDEVELPDSIEFLHDEFRVSEYMQELIDLSLIQRNEDGDQLAIHRLVQVECQHYADAGDRQDLFDLATKLLCLAFPHQQDERYGERLAMCARFIRHVYALRDNFRLKRQAVELRPSDDFCVLLRNASWYCVEVHQSRELEPTVTVAMDCARSTGFVDREPRHCGQLCNCASRLWSQRGDFSKALTFMLESKSIRERIKADVWSSINNLGNIYLSMGNTELALQTHAACMALFGGEANMPRHVLRMNKLNTGKTLTYIGRFDEATKLIDGADALNEDWLMAIHIEYHRSALLRAQGKLEMAKKGFQKSITAIKQGTPYQELLDAASHYKIGCIYMQEGNTTTARHYLQISHDLHELRRSSPCEFARVKYMLSKAMATSTDADDVKRCQSLLNEANEIRVALRGMADGEVAGEKEFDMLVESQLR